MSIASLQGFPSQVIAGPHRPRKLGLRFDGLHHHPFIANVDALTGPDTCLTGDRSALGVYPVRGEDLGMIVSESLMGGVIHGRTN
jgi:hypothetical protein